MKIKLVVIDLELSRRAKRLATVVTITALAIGVGALAYASVPHTWSDGDTLTASDLNGSFTALDGRVTALEQGGERLLKPTPFFSWTTVTAAASGVEAFPIEGRQTITFDTPGIYRITIGTQGIHDANTGSEIDWTIGGTAMRLDPFRLESAGRVRFFQLATGEAGGRQVESTVLTVSATAGQTLTLLPTLTVTFTSGNFHEANFGYLVEFLGSP